jgi:hypothetical protein
MMGALCVSAIVQGAAEKSKIQLRDCFEQKTIIAPGEKLFYETVFVEEVDSFALLDEGKKALNIRIGIVSGPNEEFVKAVAKQADHMRLKMPNCRSSDNSKERFLKSVLREVVGDDINQIPTAKETSIEIIRGQLPDYPPYEILVPGELSSLMSDLDYCECSDSSPSSRFEMIKKYACLLAAEATNVHQAIILIPNTQALKAYKTDRCS